MEKPSSTTSLPIRDSTKQYQVDSALRTLSRSSTAYPEYASKIRQGTYRINREAKQSNMSSLLKLQKKLTRRQNNPKTGDKGKLTKVSGLLSLIKNDTNVENENNVDETLPVNIRQEMIEGENAVEAVRNLEQSMVSEKETPSLSNKREESPMYFVNTGKQTAVNQSMPIISPNEESDVAAVAAWSEPLHRGAPTDEEKEPLSRRLPRLEKLPLPPSANVSSLDVVSVDTLKKKWEECKEHCKELEMEWKSLEEFEIKAQIHGVTLASDKKLIDLLVERVLDPSDHWKAHLDTLIHIPHGIKGDILRGGDYFEALFQIAIALNILPQFNGRYIRLYDIHDYQHILPFHNYLYEKPIKNSGGSEHGVSDITFEVSSNERFEELEEKCSTSYACGCAPPPKKQVSNPYYFVSVKGYKKEKSIKDEYDIPLLDSQLSIFPQITNKHIVVCVHNESAFKQKLSNMRIDFLKNKLNHIIGYDTLIQAFTAFRITFFRRMENKPTKEQIRAEIEQCYPQNVVHRPTLNLYVHQELVVRAVTERIQERQEETPHFLCIGVLPRGGKSFIAGGIIHNHQKKKAKDSGYNVLFLTSAVNETRGQFQNELVDRYSEFSDFQFINVVKPDATVSNKPNRFFFISRQLSSLTEREEPEEGIDKTAIDLLTILEKKLGQLPNIDIIFFDEAHVGITSQTVRSNFQKVFERFSVPIVMMTATYKKPARLLNDTRDLFVWDLQDIKDMKSLPTLGIEKWAEQRPDVMERYPITRRILDERIRQGESLESIAKPYLQFPTLCPISLKLVPKAIDRLLLSGAGYDFKRAFEVHEAHKDILLEPSKVSEWGSLLLHRSDALRLRQFLTPDERQKGDDEHPFLQGPEQRKYRALRQIFRIAQKNQSRPVEGKPFSMLMFLPIGKDSQGTKIGELCRVWASFMMESNYWKENFVFLTLSPYLDERYKKAHNVTLDTAVELGLCHRQDHKDDDLKCLITTLEQKALAKGKGLVILSGDVAKMGISLKCVDVVCLMTQNTDADDIIQKMYRALTDDPPNKKHGFIVDLNMARIITAMFDYDMEKDKLRVNKKDVPSIKRRLQHVFETCEWDVDDLMEDPDITSMKDVMSIIQQRVLEHIEQEVLVRTSDAAIQDETMKVVRDIPELYDEIIKTLQFTSVGNKSKKGKKEEVAAAEAARKAAEMAARKAAEMAAAAAAASAQGSQPSAAVTPPHQLTPLEPRQIESKLQSILKTFVNALVIKSAEPWLDAMNISYLIDKYKQDKKEIREYPECDCGENSECKKEHINLYETVWCELKGYAMIRGPKKDEYNYSIEIHKEILRIVERIITIPSFSLGWNVYIEKLLKDMKTPTRQGGRRRTIKKMRTK